MWLHPARLPLGGGWEGNCTAPGYAGVRPSHEELREFCNLGYANRCARLPRERRGDAVRFAVAREQANKINLCFVCEVGYRPGEHGVLEYDLNRGAWSTPHPDACVQRMAQCYLESYLERRGKQARR